MNNTERLAEYAASLRYDALPAEVRTQAAVIFGDTVGVLVAASRSDAVRLLIDKLLPARHGDEATVVGAGQRTSADFAAFVNAVGGHNIELDDSHGPSRTHAASVIVPACLAAGELSGRATVADVLVGIVAAYDVQARMSKAAGVQEMFARGFHPSAVVGAVGAAAAACSVLGTDAETTTVALGLAASQSSGLLSFEEDPSHMMKSLQTGTAARNGVLAAVMARAGFQGAHDTLDGPHSAVRAFGGEGARTELLVDELGSRYEVMGTSIKRHACCGQTHAAVDGLLDIIAAETIEPDEIEAIDSEISTSAVHIVDGNALWTHNIQYILALAAHEGWVGPEHFTDEWTTNEAILQLAKKVTVGGSADLEARFPAAKGAHVTVRARGREFRRDVPAPIGHPSVPLTAETLRGKFLALASPSLASGGPQTLFEQVQDVTLPVAELTAVFRSLTTAVA
jgi:2-methylcitrate dehydratase PrpD